METTTINPDNHCEVLQPQELLEKHMEDKYDSPNSEVTSNIETTEISSKRTYFELSEETDSEYEESYEIDPEEIHPLEETLPKEKEPTWKWNVRQSSRSNSKGISRKWYFCSFKRHGCNATKCVVTYPSGLQEIEQKREHDAPNHPTKEKFTLDPEVRKKARSDISTGVGISKLHLVMTNSAKEKFGQTDATNLPTPKQLKDIRTHQNRVKMAGHVNLSKRVDLVKKYQLSPTNQIVLIPDRTMNLLSASRVTLFVDGTFALVEDDLTVTTILQLVKEIVVPVVFLIHSSKEQTEYEAMLTCVKETVKKKYPNALKNVIMLGDYEAALANACKSALDALYFGDLFHLVQACMKWLSQNGGTDHITLLKHSLRILWQSPTAQKFKHNEQMFLYIWECEYAPFKRYFDEQWLKRIPPEKWAHYVRPNDVPSGDCVCEGFHYRFKSMYRLGEPVHKVAYTFDQESEYWYNILEDSNQLQARQKKVAEQKAQWERYRSLEQLMDPTPSSMRALQPIAQLAIEAAPPSEHNVTTTSTTSECNVTTTTSEPLETTHKGILLSICI
jgi:hypothetical protein